MRVIAGKARSLPLKSLDGLNTRPTTDRIKETIFNMISPYLADCNFLDVFAGSGAIGIEALSRGARKCVFIEKNRDAVRVIEDNLAFTKLKEDAQVICQDAVCALGTLRKEEPFDIVFMDPPYDSGLEEGVLTYLSGSNLISEDTILIIEARLDKDFTFAEEKGFEIIKVKTYKTNKHVFLRRG